MNIWDLYFFNHYLCQYGLMDIYLILWVIIQFCVICSVAQPGLGLDRDLEEPLSGWLLCLFLF